MALSLLSTLLFLLEATQWSWAAPALKLPVFTLGELQVSQQAFSGTPDTCSETWAFHQPCKARSSRGYSPKQALAPSGTVTSQGRQYTMPQAKQVRYVWQWQQSL